MATVVKVGGRDGGVHKVQGTVEEVVDEINGAVAANLMFVALIHEDGKKFSVNPKAVHEITEE